MANAAYNPFKQQMLSGGIDLPAGTVKALLVTSAYVFSAAHEFVSELSGILTNGRSPALATKTVTNGVFDADNVTLPSVNSGQTAAAIIVYLDSGSDATSRLLAFFDTNVTGLPFATTGGDITITWDDGANKIFAVNG